jgi:hypothetical protein
VVLGGISFCLLTFLLGEKIFYGFNDDHYAPLLKEKEPVVEETQELT